MRHYGTACHFCLHLIRHGMVIIIIIINSINDLVEDRMPLNKQTLDEVRLLCASHRNSSLQGSGQISRDEHIDFTNLQ